MKQSPWHLTLMFLHSKTAFYSDFSSPFNFHVVAQNVSHSKVQSILPLIQIFFHGFGLNTSAKRQCQLIGLHFRTFRGWISLLEWEDTPCFSSLYGLMEMRWIWPWTLPQCSTDNSLTSFFNKKENVLALPTVVPGTPDTKSSDWKSNPLLKYLTLPHLISLTHSIQLRVYNYLSGECV